MEGKEKMGTTGRVSILLDQTDIMTVESILMDDDAEEALKYIRDVIQPKIKEHAGEHCKPWE